MMHTLTSHDLLHQTIKKMDFFSFQSKISSVISFNFLFLFFWLLTKCSSQHNAVYCRSKVVCSEHRLSGCLLTFILISKSSIFPLSALLLSPSLIDISISAILPLRSGANQCRFFSFLLQLSFFQVMPPSLPVFSLLSVFNIFTMNTTVKAKREKNIIFG